MSIRFNSFNTNLWGVDENHNILYITGHSGSGKTTLASKLKQKNDIVINLDAYTEDDYSSPINYEFINYLSSYNNVLKALLAYSKEKYKSGKRIIVEGIQIADGWLNENYKEYSNQPLIIIKSYILPSFLRSIMRDKRRINNVYELFYYFHWYRIIKKRIKELEHLMKRSNLLWQE